MLKLFSIFMIALSLSTPIKAEIVDKNWQSETFEVIGQKSQSVYDQITKSIADNVEKIARSLSKQTAVIFSAIFSIWLMWQVILAVYSRDTSQLMSIITKRLILLAIISYLINNITAINKYIQKPLLQTYELFGGIIMGGNIDTQIVNLATQLSKVFYALNSSSGNWLTNAGQIILSLIVMFLLFSLFVQIFLILIKNYFRIMLPFAISPILTMFYFFPSFRQIPLKAINIVIDGIIKQGFIFIVVIIMSSIYANVLASIGEDINLEALIIVVIITLVYKEFLNVAESLSSELIGTQNMGTAGRSSLIGGLAGMAGIAGSLYSAYKNSGLSTGDSPTSLGGALIKGAVSSAGAITSVATQGAKLGATGGAKAWGKISPENRRYQNELKNLDRANTPYSTVKTKTGNEYVFKNDNQFKNQDNKKEDKK
ncbi:MAG: type IV secretion system protein [Alphaproteobacteria bacterium]|jgi:hypothetical protein|nr:type IV secretion system protein [Alphaproteobacteria bacterium]